MRPGLSLRISLAVALGHSACVAPTATTCDDGVVCGMGQVCAPAGGCVDPDRLAACLGVAAGDRCELASIGQGTCVEQVCVLGGCGNDTSEPGEACDDGNTVSGDGCRADCAKVEVCGDAIVDAGEACDDGNANVADGCDACVATTWIAEALLQGAVEARAVGLRQPHGVALDRAGNLYIADTYNHRIRRVSSDGTITTVAGNGSAGFSGDGAAATAAELLFPCGVAVDGLGNVFIADTDNYRIRQVDADGTITTVVGTGAYGFGGDGGPATAARLAEPYGIAVDGAGTLFIADTDNHRIRQVSPDGIITTVAGTGVAGFSGDGGSGTAAQLREVRGVAVDPSGTVYIADRDNHRVRRLGADGIITTLAGTGTAGASGDDGPGAAAQLASPHGVGVDGAGNVYIAEEGNHRIRRVDAGGTITTVAGSTAGDGGDGGPATAGRLAVPRGVAVDAAGTLYIADCDNHRIRGVDAGGGLTTAAGTGLEGYSGDGGPGTVAQLSGPVGVAVGAAGIVYIADLGHRIRQLDAAGTITTVAGTGGAGDGGDGGAGTAAQLRSPSGVAVDAAGNLYIADRDSNRIRRVDAAGTITTVAGTGSFGLAGDGGPATSALLAYPTGVAVNAAGELFIADLFNHRIRRVDVGGTITTVAGSTYGFSGDGGPGSSAQLAGPFGIALDGAGALYIGDSDNHRVRRLDPDGTITTVAGTGTAAFGGDGGPGVDAQLKGPVGVAVDATGALYIVDRENRRVRRLDPGGTITTVAGTGGTGFTGDGGPSPEATVVPWGVAVDGAGNLYLADTDNNRVRRIDAATGTITTVAGFVDPEGSGPIARATLAGPTAIAIAAPFTLFAGGAFGVVQAIRTGGDQLETVAGRYPHPGAMRDLARYRAASFGSVGGVVYDPTVGDHGGIYLTETSGARLHLVTIVDPADVRTWTIAVLGDQGPGFADGALATARFRSPSGLLLDDATRTLYVADTGNHVIRAIDLDAAVVSTLVGTPATLGFFGDGLAATDALLYAPSTMTLGAGGDLFVADSGNHRVRRVAAGTGVITTVLGDGVAASSGEGAPAATFPVNDPRGLATDALGNLFVTSSTAVRLLPADDAGVVDGSGAVQTIYGAAPRDTFPAYATSCLTGVAVVDAATVQATDACAGLLIELTRGPASP